MTNGVPMGWGRQIAANPRFVADRAESGVVSRKLDQPVDFAALRACHLHKHFRRRDAVGMLPFFRELKAKLRRMIFHVAVIDHDVQATTRAVPCVDPAHQRKHIGNRWTRRRFVHGAESGVSGRRQFFESVIRDAIRAIRRHEVDRAVGERIGGDGHARIASIEGDGRHQFERIALDEWRSHGGSERSEKSASVHRVLRSGVRETTRSLAGLDTGWPTEPNIVGAIAHSGEVHLVRNTPFGVSPYRTSFRAAASATIVACFAALSVGCGGALSGGVVNNPFHTEQPVTLPTPVTPPAPYDGHVRHFGSWLDARPDTRAFTNLITIQIDCDTPGALDAARAIATTDGRDIVVFTSQIVWGNEGYAERPDASRCWQIERAFIADYRPRVVAVWTADEPWDVAWSYWVNGVYQPNRYNGDIANVCARVHADVSVPCAVNVGSLPAGLTLPNGIALVGIEAYGTDWAAKLRAIEAMTAAPIWLLPPAFVQGDPVSGDPVMAQRFTDEYAAAKADPRITGLYPFLWCCDDTVTGTKDFYTVSGPRLPRTREVFEATGHALK